jgi:hypothetical protein
VQASLFPAAGAIELRPVESQEDEAVAVRSERIALAQLEAVRHGEEHHDDGHSEHDAERHRNQPPPLSPYADERLAERVQAPDKAPPRPREGTVENPCGHGIRTFSPGSSTSPPAISTWLPSEIPAVISRRRDRPVEGL